jgi:biopolymer transport protein ExbD
MAEKKRLLDVWIVESNTVYREVPYTVVTDWVQQGRLLADDRVRPAGDGNWQVLGKVKSLAAYLPKVEPQRVEDQAEALEPVEIDFGWKRPTEDDDEEVDMIPLIDVSLVLLIFFMMTTSVQLASDVLARDIDTPAAKHQLNVIDKEMYWVEVDRKKGPKGQILKDDKGNDTLVYGLGQDVERFVPADKTEPLTDRLELVLNGLASRLAKTSGNVRVRIRADQTIPIEHVRDLTVALQGLEGRLNQQRGQGGPGRITLTIMGEVSAPPE